METEEQWKSVDGYGGVYSDVYEVSNLGNVRRIYGRRPDVNGRVASRPGWDLKPSVQRGRRRIELALSGQPRRTVYVYRLVAAAFVPNPEGKPEVNHRNGLCGDDRAKNLEWCTPAENRAHAVRLGLMGGQQRGEGHHRAKLTEEAVRAMRALARTDYAAAVAMGVEHGVKAQSARLAINGRTWAHVA